MRSIWTLILALGLSGCSSAPTRAPASVDSGWSENARAWAAAWSASTPLFSDGNTMSVWGATKLNERWYLSRPREFLFSGEQQQFVTIKTSYLKHPMKIMISHPRGRDREALPLLVYIAPVFNDGFALTNAAFVEQMNRRGYRVIVLPNPTSVYYVQHDPTFPIGELQAEVAALVDIAAQAKAALDPATITQTQLVGRSYGGFISSVFYAIDAGTRRPVIDGNVTIIAPSVKRQKSMDHFDATLDETSGLYRSILPAKKWGEIFGSLAYASSEKNLIKLDSPDVMKAIFAYKGFQEGLLDLAEELNQIRGLGLVPQDQEARAKWRFQFRFSQLTSQFVDQETVRKKRPEIDDMSYWLSEARRELGREIPVRVLSAKDDFLSDYHDWSDFTYFTYTPKNLILLEWGGHMGYEVVPAYQKLLDEMFPPR